MYIKPTTNASGSIIMVHEQIEMEALLYPQNEDVPCPWDADIRVENGKVIVSGGMGPGHYGGSSCVCTIPVDKFSMFYKLEIPDEVAGDPSVAGAIEEAGWVEV